MQEGGGQWGRRSHQSLHGEGGESGVGGAIKVFMGERS